LLNANRLKYLYLSYLSRPASDRVLYRAIGRRNVRKFLEIGVGPSRRTLRMIDLAGRVSQGESVRYAAIDMFEARPPGGTPGLSLKEAHKLLKSTGAQVQLIPGDPASALARSANALMNMDLVIISAEHDEASLAEAWFYLPRMLHANSAVYLETKAATAAGANQLTLLAADEIARRATPKRTRRAA
jgi:hypothetical protein